jgi:hypothetical protein
MVVTLTSQYYRLIQIPESFFGLIGSTIAIVGLIIPRLARAMVDHRTPEFNLMVMTVLAIVGLVGMTIFIPWFGIIPVILISAAMYLLRFFQSHYLNRITSSDQRATVLSFKGLSMNLAYGLVGILYSLLVRYLRSTPDRLDQKGVELSSEAMEGAVFIESMGWFPWYFSVTTFLVLAYGGWRLYRQKDSRNQIPL